MIQQQAGAPTMIQYSEFDKALRLPQWRALRRGASQGSGHIQPKAQDAWVTTLPIGGSGPTIPRGPGRGDSLSTLIALNRGQQRMYFLPLPTKWPTAWQHRTSATPSRAGYHNVQWGQKHGGSIGLIPSNTGQPGGDARPASK